MPLRGKSHILDLNLFLSYQLTAEQCDVASFSPSSVLITHGVQCNFKILLRVNSRGYMMVVTVCEIVVPVCSSSGHEFSCKCPAFCIISNWQHLVDSTVGAKNDTFQTLE